MLADNPSDGRKIRRHPLACFRRPGPAPEIGPCLPAWRAIWCPLMRSRLLFPLLAGLIGSLSAAGAAPHLYWSAEPVLPGEAAMLQGAGFDTVSRIELRADGKTVEVPVLDANERSLRFVIPADWPAGAVTCRIETATGHLEHQINAPQPWWHQADAGRAASPGGWVRICGRCLDFGGQARLTLRQGDQTWALPIDEPTPWSLHARLPATMAPGTYDMWVHNGSAEAKAGDLTVAASDLPWMKTVIDFAGVPDDDGDDSDALTRAVADVAARGGGVVRFPRGRFRLSGGFSLPPRIVLSGAGAALTHLVWADTATPPEAFLSSQTGELAIEDLSLYAHHYRKGLVVRAPKDAPPAREVRISRVQARFTALSVKGLDPATVQSRLDSLRDGAVFEIFADDVQIVDCDLAWTKNVGFSAQGNDLYCVGNRAHADEAGWCPVGGGRRAIVERNAFTGVTTGITRGAEVYFARNRVSHQYHGFREGFTTDGAYGGPGQLSEPVVAGAVITHAGASPRTDPASIPAVVRVIDGPGAGQWREVKAFEPTRLVMDRPFDVPVGEGSRFYVSNAMMRHILFENDWSDTGIAAQFYGGALDCIMAGNRSARSGGFRAWGNETAWYVQMLGNEITEGYGTAGPEANGGHSALHLVGPYLTRNEPRFTGTTVRGAVMRRNELHNHATITLRGAIHDALIENNVLRHSPKGIVGDLWQRQSGILLLGNRFEDVTTPHEPEEAGYRKIDRP